ncbi:ATP-dependent DNA helicase DDX11 [Blattella germanica]|nr:ATP-dependent DNA helicase DDX11 [Blattella germanica]
MSEEKLLSPDEFPFPFTPYPIQQDFMKHLYSALEDGKLGIFESPTGTKTERKFDKKPETVQEEGLDDHLLAAARTDTDLDDADILLEDAVDDPDLAEESDAEQEDEEYQGVKIYFCSRTHSQLAQFVGEVQQNMQRKKKGKTTAVDKSGKAVKKSKGSSGCPYFQQRAVEKLRDEALFEVQDVEQLVTVGKKLSACPYYASRSAVGDAQSTRKACGINLTGSIVIIDEAHNLLDTIGHIHSSEVTGHQVMIISDLIYLKLTHAYSQLIQYRDRYRNRFSASNLLTIHKLLPLLTGGKPGCNPVESSLKGIDTKLYTLADFVLTAEIDNMNLYKLIQFCHNSKLAHKLHGFAERYQPALVVNLGNKTTQAQKTGIRAFLKEISSTNNATVPKQEESASAPLPEVATGNPLLSVLSFMEALTNHCSDGRVVCSRQATVGRGSVKFLLLNPAAHFSDVVKEARAVIVAGGTMQPLEEFRDQLFIAAGGSVGRLAEFSCGHVIPPENILPIALATGPSGKELDFSYQSRANVATLNELGRILTNICNVVPAGVVCFFPSYDYEKLVYQHLEKSGIITKLELKKKVFREPKRAGMIDQVLSEFAACISKPESGGALMFSVVGTYMGPTAGHTHYENLCMKAVNQSIGRAVRHKNDYAAVLLLDQRYTRPHTQASLPAWIQKSLSSHSKFGPAFAQVNKVSSQHAYYFKMSLKNNMN